MATAFPSGEDGVLGGRIRVGAVAAFVTLAFGLSIMLFDRIGVPRRYLVLFAFFLLAGAILLPAAQAATMSYAQWLVAGRRAAGLLGAMAIAVTLLSGWAFLAAAGDLFTGASDGPVWMAALMLAPALSSFLLAPYLRASGAATLPALIAYRFASPAAGALAVFAVAAAGILFVSAQLLFAMRAAAPFAPGSPMLAGAAVALLALAPIAAGGLRALLRVNAILFAVAATAYLAPLAWLSVSLAQNPLPVLAYWSGAGGDIAVLEQARAMAGEPLLAARVAAGAPMAKTTFEAAVAACLLALGLAVSPPLTAFYPPAPSPRAAQYSAGWSILLVALVLSSAPALAAFVKLALYQSFDGLTLAEAPARAPFLLDWPAVEGGRRLIEVCGAGDNGMPALVARCGGGAGRTLLPADISIAREAVTLAMPAVAGLPPVYGALLAAAAIAASVAAASAALFSVAASIAGGIAADPGRHGEASGRRLFAGRIAALIAMAAALAVAGAKAADPGQLLTAAASVCLAALAPVALAAIWSDRANRFGAVSALLFAPLAFLFLRQMRLYGIDFRVGTGDEFAVALPGLAGLPTEVNEAAIIAAVAVGLLHGVSALTGGNPDRQRLDRIRLPDAEQPLPEPSA
jgi:cation/acetate symporter